MSYIRLHIVSEGPTERLFAEKVLSEYYAPSNIIIDSRSILTSKDKKTNYEHRGGIRKYSQIKKDIELWFKQDNHPECRFTTMIDFYALPTDFPGYDQAQPITDPYKKIEFLEQSFEQDISNSMFIPYIQLHEFETLIFSDPQKLEIEYLDNEEGIQRLFEVKKEFINPELINDYHETCPSRRIKKEISEYSKTLAWKVCREIGIERMKQECKHFNEWIAKIESLI